jgi:hypothetical protein
VIDKMARAAGIAVGTVFFGAREALRKLGRLVTGRKR